MLVKRIQCGLHHFADTATICYAQAPLARQPCHNSGEMEEQQCAIAEELFVSYQGWRDLTVPQMLADESVRLYFAAFTVACHVCPSALNGDARSQLV